MRCWLQKEGPSHRRFTNCRNIWRLLRPGNLLQTEKVTIHIYDCINSVTGGRFFCKKSSVLKFCLKLMYIVLYQGKTHFSFRFPQLQFDYKDPEKNFDRSKVHGLVCKLIKIKDVKMATALEVSAGGKVRELRIVTEMFILSLPLCVWLCTELFTRFVLYLIAVQCGCGHRGDREETYPEGRAEETVHHHPPQ